MGKQVSKYIYAIMCSYSYEQKATSHMLAVHTTRKKADQQFNKIKKIRKTEGCEISFDRTIGAEEDGGTVRELMVLRNFSSGTQAKEMISMQKYTRKAKE